MTRPYLLDSVQLLRGSVDDDGDARYSHLSQNVPDGYVGDLQSDLMTLGFEEVGTPDGAFGANTRAAVKAFEELADVPQNGIVERSTKNAMQTWLDHGYTKASRPGAAPVAVPAGTSHIIGPRVVHYSQGDPRWASRTLGMNSPIQKKGCAICCVAMTLSFYGRAATPLTLDEHLDASNGYQGDSVVWGVAGRHLEPSGGALRYDRATGSEAQLHDLLGKRIMDNRPTLVRVDYGSDAGIAYNHFVVGVGRTANGDFVMNDPATRRGDGYATLENNVIGTTTRNHGYRIVQLDWYDPV